MKFKLIETVDEKFNNEYTKQSHYDKHVAKEHQYTKINPDEYEAIADELALKPVDYKNILGYETTGPKGDNRARYAKYNVATGDFVIYGYKGSEPIIISLHRKTIREYNIDKAIKYIGEIPEGK